MATEKPRFSITVPDSMLDDIVDFQNANNFATRSRAIQQLIRLGIDDLTKGSNKKSPALSSEAMRLAKDYDALDEHGQHVVRVVADEELSRMAAEEEPEPDVSPATRMIPLFNQPFAAGAAEPDLGLTPAGSSEPNIGLMWQDYEVPADSRADFAIRVHGTSMEPWLRDGQIVLGVRRQPGIGEVGAFTLNGEYVIKLFYYTELGRLTYLFSANRKEADRDIVLTQEQAEAANLRYIGTILTERRIPLPKAF